MKCVVPLCTGYSAIRVACSLVTVIGLPTAFAQPVPVSTHNKSTARSALEPLLLASGAVIPNFVRVIYPPSGDVLPVPEPSASVLRSLGQVVLGLLRERTVPPRPSKSGY